MLAVFLAITLCAPAQSAYANPLAAFASFLGLGGESNDPAAQAVDEFDGYTVPTVSPSGTTINLFDYWIQDQYAYDGYWDLVNPKETNPNGMGPYGINEGKQLNFTGYGDKALNQYPDADKGPRYNIVSNNLVNGYPELRSDAALGTTYSESLAYLFDSSAKDGKESHFNVTGLLQQVGGYYEYDSAKNYAAYDADTNAFKVYNKPAVSVSGSSDEAGQFFPFNPASEVFDVQGNEIVAKEGVTSRSANMHHYFGVSMSSRFIQPTGGKTNTGENMVFEFTGDDDVWVFIDGVLVGDVGGVHDASTVSINFATGAVDVSCPTSTTNPGIHTDLLKLFEKAGASTVSFEGETFRDGTEHTLNFYYLERGGADSNMKLKFNLVTIPNSDIVKTDQDGDPIEGAEFALYKANANYEAQGAAIATGRTDASGQLTLISAEDGTVINFDTLRLREPDTPDTMHYLLKETKVPDGYRTGLSNTGDSMHLVYTWSEVAQSGVLQDDGGTGKDSPIWKNGAFAGAKETITAKNDLYRIADDGFARGEKFELGDGTLFAVVLKRAGAGLDDQDSWRAMSGDPIKGYTVETEGGIAGAIAAANKDGHPILLNSSGQLQVELTDLPGDITKYYFMLGDNEKSQSEYTVAVYYTTAGSIADAKNDGTTWRVFSDDFDRQFSARLYIPNIENRLYVQKDDGAGNYLAGADFSLYTADQVVNGQLIEGAQAYDTVTTVKHLASPLLDGAAMFPNAKPLMTGEYYLKETKAPDGYKVNDTLIKVVVDNTGVYADAGVEGDGVSTFAGVGQLVKSMAQFGVEGDLNNSLTWLKGTRQTWSGVAGGLWTDVDPVDDSKDILHLEYGAAGGILEYGPATEGGAYRLETDKGWLRVGVTQDEKPTDADPAAGYTELDKNQNLNALLSGAMGVRVTDEPISRLEVTKTVEMGEGLTGDPDAEFMFEFDLDYADGKTYAARVFGADGKMVGEERTLSGPGILNPDATNRIAIKADQTIRVYGLATDSEYTVTEVTDGATMPDGYELTARTVGGVAYQQGTPGVDIKGTIVAIGANDAIDSQNQLGFVNTYTATPASLPAQGQFGVQKILTGRDGGAWLDVDKYTMVLMAAGFDADPTDNVPADNSDEAVAKVPLPDGFDKNNHSFETVVDKNTPDHAVSFGELTYGEPGTYSYYMYEETPKRQEDHIPGVNYSDAYYAVDVEVIDLGDGALTVASVTITQEESDTADPNFDSVQTGKVTFCDQDGKPLATPVVEGDMIADITNAFTADAHPVSLNATKIYDDQSGANPLTAGMFTLALMPVSLDGNTAQTSIDDMPLPGDQELGKDGKIRVPVAADKKAVFGTIMFNNIDHVSHEYVYEIREVNDGKPGVGYDGTAYRVTYTVSEDAALQVQVDIKWQKSVDGGATFQDVTLDSVTGPTFTNTYSVTSVDASLPTGQKTISGRPWYDGETYSFALTPADPATRTAIDNDYITGIDSIGLNVETSTPADGVAVFSFGDGGKLTFTRPGTYKFNVNEVITDAMRADAAKNGMTYDAHIATVTYVVSDTDASGNHTGALTVTGPTYNNTTALTDADRTSGVAAFTNTYAATGAFSGISVTKTMQGSALANSTYTFKIEPQTVGGIAAPAVPAGDGEFRNSAAAEGVAWTRDGLLKYNLTQQSLGRTYVYKVYEGHGVDGNGVAYDTLNKGDAYVIVQVMANPNSPKDLYTKTTVIKGLTAGAVIAALDDGKSLDDALAMLSGDDYRQVVDSRDGGAGVPTVNFENTYTAGTTDATAAAVAATKTLTGRSTEADEFNFELKTNPIAEDADGTLLATGVNAKADAGAAGAVNFTVENGVSGLEFKDGKLVFSYTLDSLKQAVADGYAEQLPQTNTWKVYYTASEKTDKLPAGVKPVEKRTSYDLTVTVTNDLNGVLAAVADSSSLSFENAYEASGSLEDDARIAVSKTLDGRDWKASETYEFKLEGADGAPMPADAKDGVAVLSVGEPNGDTDDSKRDTNAGKFGAIAYDQTHAGKDFAYKVTELAANSDANMTYSLASYEVKVCVTDNGNGTLAPTVTSVNRLTDDDGISAAAVMVDKVCAFTNTYKEPEQEKDVALASDANDPKTSVNGQMVGVGDELVYTIDWVNTAVDVDGKAAKAEITITDEIPVGTKYVDGSADNSGTCDGKTVSWNLGEQDPNATGTVTFKVEVTDAAVTTGEIANTATVNVGPNNPKTTNKVTNTVPKKSVDATGEVQVGQKLTYTIEFDNDKGANADATVVDTLSKGLSYNSDATVLVSDVALPDGAPTVNGQELTWNIAGLPDGAKVKITFSATVTEDAVSSITNEATVNNKSTNEVTNNIAAPGSLTISKEVTVESDQGLDADKIKKDSSFTFKVKLTDAYDVPLTGEYTLKGDHLDKDGSIKSGGTVELKDGQSIVVEGLPAGAKYTVTETDLPAGFTQTAPAEGDSAAAKPATGSIAANTEATAAFANHYKADGAKLEGDAALKVQKTFTGRAWNDADEFEFTVTKVSYKESDQAAAQTDEATLKAMPEIVGAQIGKPKDDAADKTVNTGSLGNVTFTKTGIYEYQVAETAGTLGGVTYDTHKAKVIVTVTDTNDAGAHDGKLHAAVKYDNTDATTADKDVKTAAAFTNTYMAGGLDAQINVKFTKSFNGWNAVDVFDGKTFEFTITPQNGAPKPANEKVTVSRPNTGTEATFDFGSIAFKASDLAGATSKNFTYEVAEVLPMDAGNPVNQKDGVTYDTRKAKVIVTVTDNGTGVLSASAVVDGDTVFTNTYSSELDYDAAGGLKITKTLNGRDMINDQFAFTVTPKDTKDDAGNTLVTADEAAKKLGIDSTKDHYKVTAANDGAISTIDLLAGKDVEFTQDDAGKTYTYEIMETTGGNENEGYVNDDALRVVTIAVADKGDGGIKVTTTVTGGVPAKEEFVYETGDSPAAKPAVVPFVNSYMAKETYFTIQTTKELTGRKLTEGEFTFAIKTNTGDPATSVEVCSVKNDSGGKVTFPQFKYTIDSLKQAVLDGYAVETTDATTGNSTWTLDYTAFEKTDGLKDNGITATKAGFDFTVTVKDNGDGTLTATSDVAADDVFVNTYSTNGTVPMNFEGKKVLEDNGLNPDSIDDEFSFKVTAVNGGPLPKKDGAVCDEVTNAADGSIDFGQIVFTLDDLSKALGTNAADAEGGDVRVGAKRSFDFTYEITETGSADGVTNDLEKTKTVTFRVTDDGKGGLTAERLSGAAGPAFTFTNTYSVEEKPSSLTGVGNFTLTKELDGRPMAASEFTFNLYKGDDVVATGTNDVNGNVEISDITFKEPGTFTYKLVEAKGDKGGVTYDKTSYEVTATVTDNGDGTLSVKWSVKKADGTEVAATDPIIFANTYKADGATVNLGAAKLLNDGKPSSGQFTFQVLNEAGKVVAEAKNDEFGGVQFPALDEFTAAGEYTYTIVEVNDGQEGVTYDDAKFGVKVVVSDTDANGNYTGKLHATVEYTDGAPVFKNTYTPPTDPVDPGTPGGSGDGSQNPPLAKTGDGAAPLVVGLAALTLAACAGLAALALGWRRGARPFRMK